MSIWEELKRRKVIQVATVYAVVAWLLIQIVGEIAEPLELPTWFHTFVIVTLAVGFPIALVLAWAFDLSPQGVRPESSISPEASAQPTSGLFVYMSQIVIIALVGFLIVDQYLLDGSDRGRAIGGSSTSSVSVFPIAITDNHPVSSSRWSEFSLALEGRRLVYQTDLGIFVRDFGSRVPRFIAGSDNIFAAPFLSPDGSFVAYYSTRGALAKLPISEGISQPVVSGLRAISSASWAQDGYIYLSNDNLGIVRVHEDGGEIEPLIPPSLDVVFNGPRLLPDNDTLIYSAKADDATWDEAGIYAYAMSTPTEEPTLVYSGGSDASYVPTGHLVFVVGDSLYAIAFDPDTFETTGAAREIETGVTRSEAVGSANYGISVDGTLAFLSRRAAQRRKLVWFDRSGNPTDFAMEPGNYWYLQLSPDDSLVALNGWEDATRHVWTADVSSGQRWALSVREELQPSTGIWTPDGEVVYTRGIGNGENEIAMRLGNRSGSSQPRYRMAQGEFVIPTAVTPDGLQLLATTAAPPRSTWKIALDEPDAPAERILGNDQYSMYNASVSPDGRWVAFQSDKTGRLEVYVRPYPGVDSGLEYQISRNGGLNAVWSRDERGSELFFLEPIDEPGMFTLMSFAVDASATDGPFNAVPVPLFRGRFFANFSSFGGPYDVSLDGSRFLVIQEAPLEDATSETSEVVIVQNWTEKLQALVPVN